MSSNISTVWIRQIYNPKTKKFRAVKNETTLGKNEVYIIHIGGSLVLLSKKSLDRYGIRSKFAKSNNGSAGYSAYFRYENSKKKEQFAKIEKYLKGDI